MTSLHELAAEGERVVVRTVRPSDVEAYRAAVLQSRSRLARWNPVDPDDLLRHLARQSDVHRTFLLLARDDEGSHGVVGRVNVTNIVRGRFQSGVLGYDAFDPYAGRGLFAEGLALVVGLSLRPTSRGGVGLHRVEANVQPGNVASAGVLRSLGFRHEGSSPRMLLLAGPGDGEKWRDHERYAVTAEEWPAPTYRVPEHRRLVVLVGGPADARRAALAAALSTELGLPLLVGAPDGPPDGALDGADDRAPDGASDPATGGAADPATDSAAEGAPDGAPDPATGGAPATVPASVTAAASHPAPAPFAGTASRTAPPGAALAGPALWSVLRGCPTGAVVDAPWDAAATPEVHAGLRRAGAAAGKAVQVWCCAAPADEPGAPTGWGLGHDIRVNPSSPIGAAQVTRVALLARAPRDETTPPERSHAR